MRQAVSTSIGYVVCESSIDGSSAATTPSSSMDQMAESTAWLKAQGIPESEWNSASAVVDPEGRGPRIYFQRVPEGKVVKNRVHLDLNVGGPRGAPQGEQRRRVDAEVERLEGLGARRSRVVEERGEYFVNMFDPEGNEFDLQ